MPVVTSPALVGLDEEQAAAVHCLEGPLVILAGAGTGKTRAITHRIAYGVETGAFEARRTLAVTFTSRAAGEMRTRLARLGVAGVQARTFHSAALRQLRYFWPRVSNSTFPDLIASKARLVSEAAGQCGITGDAATMRDLISDLEWVKANCLTGELVESTRLGALAARHARELTVDPADLARLVTRYEDLKVERHVIDFEDVLSVLTGILTDRVDIADEVQTAYRWFTVDEFQDVNPLQDRLLTQWLGGRDDLCVVGDPGQTIYSFTGASARYLLDFQKTYADATVVRLVRCYRCTPQIVGLANAVTTSSEAGLMLVSQGAPGPEVTVRSWADDVEEATSVARGIRDAIDGGVAPRDIAVLFRINAQSEAIEEACAELGIPVVLRGVERFFDRPEVKEALRLLRGAAAGGDSHATLVDDVTAVLSSMGWTPEAPRTTGAVRERWESLSALVNLAGELASDVGESLVEFVAELRVRAEAQHAPTADGVTLASIHSAKGLEWHTVYVIGCSDGLIPVSSAITAEQRQEERRLLYVAITRAATFLHLSWAQARQPGGRASREMSPFLREALAVNASGVVVTGASVARGPRRGSKDKSRQGPAKCRICRKALPTGAERAVGRCRTCPADVNEALLDALRAWRKEQAAELQSPAFVVFTDATLIAIAETSPSNDEQLLAIPGIGERKLDAFGSQVLRLVREYGD